MRIVAISILGLMLAGCNSLSPTSRVAVARQAYTSTLNSLRPMVDSGLISDPTTLRQILRLSNDTAALLDLAESQAMAGGAGVDGTLKSIDQLLASLATLYARNKPATRPVTLLETPWTLPRSSPSFAPASLAFKACPKSSPLSTTALN